MREVYQVQKADDGVTAIHENPMEVKYGETNPTPAKPATGFKLRNWHGLAAFAVVIAISNAFSQPTEHVATETHADRVAELH